MRPHLPAHLPADLPARLAGRSKDTEFCRALIRSRVVEPATLLDRLNHTDAAGQENQRAQEPDTRGAG
jgi:hypothetical protein